MQTAFQRTANRPAPATEKSVRGETLKAIHATWRKVVRGVDVNDKDELRASRMAFANNVLKLDPPIESFKDKRVTPKRLGAVLDEMRRLERAPSLPGVEFGVPTLVGASAREKSPTEVGTLNASQPADVHHLATAAQVAAIGKLVRYLGWSAIGEQAFIEQRYHRTSARMLTPTQANALTMILFNIAGAKIVRANGHVGTVPRWMSNKEIPRLKRELGIDQKPFTTEDTEEEFNG